MLIEKLLRSCNQINRIFILVRSKRGKSALDRVKEFEECVVGEAYLKMGDFELKCFSCSCLKSCYKTIRKR